MAFIYKITNLINNKLYIGKTELTVEKRWKQHISDCKRDRCKDRPLYRALNLHGVDNFTIEMIEETSNPEEREVYWIDFYGTYRSGYNATKGGDGKSHVDVSLILKLHNEGLSNKEIKFETNYDDNTISRYLQKLNLKPNLKISSSKKVKCLELDKIFDSQRSAAEYIKPDYNGDRLASVANKISLCCRGLRKRAYSYTWEYQI